MFDYTFPFFVKVIGIILTLFITCFCFLCWAIEKLLFTVSRCYNVVFSQGAYSVLCTGSVAGEVVFVDVTPCPKVPCVLKLGTYTVFAIRFKTSKNALEYKKNMYTNKLMPGN